MWSHAEQLMLVQGMCTNEQCPYAHVNVDPVAPICQDFVRGHCPRGTACPRRHMTPRMIRASKVLAAKRLVSRRQIGSCAGHCLVLSSMFAVFEATPGVIRAPLASSVRFAWQLQHFLVDASCFVADVCCPCGLCA